MHENRAVRSYGLNSCGDAFRESGDGLSWEDYEGLAGDPGDDEPAGSRRISEVIYPSVTFAYVERDMPADGVNSFNLLGIKSNALATKGQYQNDPITNNYVNYTVHGEYKLTFSMVDGSTNLLDWVQFSKRGYWRHDETP